MKFDVCFQQDVALSYPCFRKIMEFDSRLEHLFEFKGWKAVLLVYIRCSFEAMQLKSALPYWVARVSISEETGLKSKEGNEFLRRILTKRWSKNQLKFAKSLLSSSLEGVGTLGTLGRSTDCVFHTKKLNDLELEIVRDSVTAELQEIKEDKK